MKRSWIASFLGCLITTTTLAAPQTLTIHNGPEPDSLDPHLTSSVDGSNLGRQLFEGLVTFNPEKPTTVIGGVAEKWTISPDGKTYTFYLRNNATWSDGSRITANDFLYGWRRAIDPKTASPQGSRYNYIKNGKAFLEGKIKDPSLLGFKVINDTTFQVELEGPFPPFLQLITFSTFAPIKKDVVEKYGDQWVKPEHMVCNGPFLLKMWTPYDRIVMIKNPLYWDAIRVRLDGVTFLMIDDFETILKRYEAGDIDFFYSLPQGKVPSYMKHPDFHSSSEFALYQYMFNVKHPALQDARVRRALALSIDRKLIVDKIMRGREIPATGFIPPGVSGYAYKTYLRFDPQEAKKLLAEAGYPDGKNFPILTLSYNTVEVHRLIGEAIQQMWKQNLGIEVKLQNQEWKTHLAALHHHDFEIARLGGVGEYVYPTTFLENFTAGTSGNYSQWTNPKYDQLWDEAKQAATPARQLRLMRQMEDIIMEEMPWAPIYNSAIYWMTKPRVKNLTLLPGRAFFLKYASVR
ncbi:MAG: peptide ABC transporter substrate-binding protein [Deltaproteobacteria bacterium]|nr:peptide ABC transporter substrate-binding protein [Deltaproteobacteria bacterium]